MKTLKTAKKRWALLQKNVQKEYLQAVIVDKVYVENETHLNT